jgi:peptidylprolyl isomerase
MILDGKNVKVHYEGTLDDGTAFDSSHGREPLEYKIGAQQVIPGFEQAVREMEVGETKTFKVPSQDAYGEIYQELVATFGREQMPPEIDPQEGMTLTLQTNQGEIPVRVTGVTEKSVTVDGNHPLAGENLNFTVTLLEVV